MSKQNEGSAAIHNAVSQLLINGNVKGALALANCLHAPGRSITASAVTSPKREKKVVIKTTKAKVSLVKAKAKAKVKSSRYTHAHKDVKLTARQWAVWLAVKALLNAKEEYAKAAGHDGFYSLSGKFVATFMGTPFWTKKEVDRVNAVMVDLNKKGLLTWAKEKVGKSKRKIKGSIAFGPKA